jgi:hypothetical protein
MECEGRKLEVWVSPPFQLLAPPVSFFHPPSASRFPSSFELQASRFDFERGLVFGGNRHEPPLNLPHA